MAPRRARCCVGSLTVRYFTGLDGYSPRPPHPSEHRVQSRAHLRVLRADHGCCLASDYRTRAVRLCACAAPTPAPTNPGDTNPPTRAPTTSAPTYAPNFADPTGKSDAKPSAPLPPQAAQCINGVARGTRYYCEMPVPRLCQEGTARYFDSARTGQYPAVSTCGPRSGASAARPAPVLRRTHATAALGSGLRGAAAWAVPFWTGPVPTT
jgi:hypothetical protein